MRHFVIGMCVLLFIQVGCKRPPTVKVTKTDEKRTAVEASPFRSAMETFRYPDNPQLGIDWSRFREGMLQLKPYFDQDNVRERARLSASEREFLEKRTELPVAIVAELEGVRFRDTDAHYLDECYLLRDIAKSTNVSGVAGLALAEHHFRWVMRNVVLHEQVDQFAPPAFVLRRGYAGALERAVVFLGLLRQAKLDGCLLIAPPDGEATPFLVGVINPKTEKLHLFDTRLGLPLRGKDNRLIATLEELQADASLGQRSKIDAAHLQKMTATLVLPLQGLAPRMLELQKGMTSHEAIVLHVDAGQIHANIAKAVAPMPVTAWTNAGPANPAPTWWLTQFLPPQEGGTDNRRRTIGFAASSGPLANVVLNYAQVNLTKSLLPAAAWNMLLGISDDLINKYDVQPREMFLHGQHEAMIRRLDRMQKLTKNDLFSGLAEDKVFRTDLAAWQKTAGLAYARLGSEDARQRGQGQYELQELWRRDPVLDVLINLDKDDKIEHEDRTNPKGTAIEDRIKATKPSMLVRILAVGMREVFDLELARIVAGANHEKAASAQAAVDASLKPTDSAKERADEAWGLAKTSWSSFYLSRLALDFIIEQRVEQAKIQPILIRIPLLESMHRDTFRILNAKLRLSECVFYTQGQDESLAYLTSVKSEIEGIEKKGLMAALTAQTLAELRQHSGPEANALTKRLELLDNDWRLTGTYAWLKQHIDARIAGWR